MEVLRWPDHLTQAAIEWLSKDMERPGKNEWYHMSTATEIRRVLSSKPREHQVEHLRLSFRAGTPEDMDENQGLTLEEQKKRDMAAFGGRGVYTPPPARPEGDDYSLRDTARWEDPLT